MENKDLKKILKEQIPQEEKIGFAPNKTSEKNTGDSYSKITSNKSGEGIEEKLSFATLTKRDKKLIEEVIELLQENQNSSVKEIKKRIEQKFKISEIPMMEYEESLWHQLTKNENIGMSVQGYREITEKDGTKLRIPHVHFSTDLDYLDELVKRMFTTIRNLNIK
jgi:uncharacterized protein YdiU (UPF0061 family)